MKVSCEISSYFGGVKNMALEMGCTSQYIYQGWSPNYVPKTAAFQLEVITKGYFKALDLRAGILPQEITKNGFYLNNSD